MGVQQSTGHQFESLQQFQHRFIMSNHPLYPNNQSLRLLHEKLTNKQYLLAIISTNQDFERVKLNDLLCRKLATPSNSIIPLQQYVFQEKSGLCSKMIKCFLIFKLNDSRTLKHILLQKQYQGRQRFTYLQLQTMIDHICSALLWLKYVKHPHGNLSTQTIYYTSSPSSSFFLTDPWIAPPRQPGGYYPSPQKLMKMTNQTDQYEDPSISDLFSLGMVVLQCLFGIPTDVYKPNYKIDKKKVAEYVNLVQHPGIKEKLRVMLLGNPQEKNAFLQQYYLNSEHNSKRDPYGQNSNNRSHGLEKDPPNPNPKLYPQNVNWLKRQTKFKNQTQRSKEDIAQTPAFQLFHQRPKGTIPDITLPKPLNHHSQQKHYLSNQINNNSKPRLQIITNSNSLQKLNRVQSQQLLSYKPKTLNTYDTINNKNQRKTIQLGGPVDHDRKRFNNRVMEDANKFNFGYGFNNISTKEIPYSLDPKSKAPMSNYSNWSTLHKDPMQYTSKFETAQFGNVQPHSFLYNNVPINNNPSDYKSFGDTTLNNNTFPNKQFLPSPSLNLDSNFTYKNPSQFNNFLGEYNSILNKTQKQYKHQESYVPSSGTISNNYPFQNLKFKQMQSERFPTQFTDNDTSYSKVNKHMLNSQESEDGQNLGIAYHNGTNKIQQGMIKLQKQIGQVFARRSHTLSKLNQHQNISVNNSKNYPWFNTTQYDFKKNDRQSSNNNNETNSFTAKVDLTKNMETDTEDYRKNQTQPVSPKNKYKEEAPSKSRDEQRASTPYTEQNESSEMELTKFSLKNQNQSKDMGLPFSMTPENQSKIQKQRITNSNPGENYQSDRQLLRAKQSKDIRRSPKNQQNPISYSPPTQPLGRRSPQLSNYTNNNNYENQSPQNRQLNQEHDNELQHRQDIVSTPIRHGSQLETVNNLTIPQESDEDSESSKRIHARGQPVQEIYQNGGQYKGYIRNGKRDGQGTFYYKDGGYYEGHWKNNMMNGFGRLYYDTGKLAYEGNWYKDQFHGRGKVFNDAPHQLPGQFDYTDFQNIELYWQYYDGDLIHDSKEGFGKIMLSNGQSFEGEFKGDKVHGKGTFKTKDGYIIKGIWNNCKLQKTIN